MTPGCVRRPRLAGPRNPQSRRARRRRPPGPPDSHCRHPFLAALCAVSCCSLRCGTRWAARSPILAWIIAAARGRNGSGEHGRQLDRETGRERGGIPPTAPRSAAKPPSPRSPAWAARAGGRPRGHGRRTPWRPGPDDLAAGHGCPGRRLASGRRRRRRLSGRSTRRGAAGPRCNRPVRRSGRMDTRLLRRRSTPGSTIPAGGPYRYTAPSPGLRHGVSSRPSTAGFLNGHTPTAALHRRAKTILPLHKARPRSSSTATAGQSSLGPCRHPPPDVVSVRRTLDLLVRNGKAVPASTNDTAQWPHPRTPSMSGRSAVGHHRNGAWSTSAAPGSTSPRWRTSWSGRAAVRAWNWTSTPTG